MSGFPPHGLLPLSHAGYLLSRPNAFDQDVARALSAEEMQPRARLENQEFIRQNRFWEASLLKGRPKFIRQLHGHIPNAKASFCLSLIICPC
jgi:hypothetical protein